LILAVRQRLRGRHGDRVTGVNAHRIEVLDRADDHDVVLAVAHHLQLEFLPADDRFLDQQFVVHGHVEPAASDLVIVLHVKQEVYEEINVTASRVEGKAHAPVSIASTVVRTAENVASPTTLTELVDDPKALADNSARRHCRCHGRLSIAR
jgi:hypothetical protein